MIRTGTPTTINILTGTVTGSPVHHASGFSPTIIALMRLNALSVDHSANFIYGHYVFKLTERGAELLDRLSQ